MTPTRVARLTALQRPVPIEQPEYDHAAGHTHRGFRLNVYGLLDTLFIVAGLVISIWLALLYLVEGFSLTPVRMLYLVGFWILLTYITLPRLHQLLTWIYLPDYFFGRTRTTEGVLSDPINLAFDGTEQDLHVAMRKAGWVLAEERTVASGWAMVHSTLRRRSYPAAPVSPLYLLGRRHDFTYQQEVGGTTDKRHHVRFWKMPSDFALPGGYRVDWLAAGTYDRAVGFSFFTLQITHRIDENIDVERDYVIDTIRHADPQVEGDVIREFSAAYADRNGQGDPIRTDGHLPILNLHGVAARSEGATAVMLLRNRPTGTTVMKARAHAAAQSALAAAGVRRREGVEGPLGRDGGTGVAVPVRQELADEIAAQWQGTREDLQEAVFRAVDHHLPPPTVAFTGLLVLLQTALVLAQWVGRAMGVDLSTLTADASLLFRDDDSLLLSTAFAAALLLMTVGVLRRSRWARIALMGLFSVDAFARLALATALDGDVAHSTLVAVGASALGVLAISSDASRMWVQTLRLPARIPEDASDEV